MDHKKQRRIVDARNPEGEFVVATAVCEHCDEVIEKWCIPLEVEGQSYPPEYLWRHASDGVVLCDWVVMAAPREGTISHVHPA